MTKAATTFLDRHLGPRDHDVRSMLATLGYDSLDGLIDAIVPKDIRLGRLLDLPAAISEPETLAELRARATENQVYRSYLGMGYSNCHVPGVIQRNILENPGWYTAYTPYQPEIAQGRLEALLNFQTMVCDLTGLQVANASLLDEGTAAAEAMALSLHSAAAGAGKRYLIDARCHPQTIAVVATRADARGVATEVGDPTTWTFDGTVIGCLLQYPCTEGSVRDLAAVADRAHAVKAVVTAATDLLALTMLKPPGEWGADIAVGNSQRFGVPLGYGGPHAAFLAAKDAFKRQLPGRIIGVSKDRDGRPALRMALQTREQHIRREKATSNICTAQVLLAVMASMYAVYHGPEGLTTIARRVHHRTRLLAAALEKAGFTIAHRDFFDTIAVDAPAPKAAQVLEAAIEKAINLRAISPTRIGIALDETTSPTDLADILACFDHAARLAPADLANDGEAFGGPLARTSPFLTHPVFHRYRSETEMLRYLHRLEARDLSLTSAMIPLGSCTMKLNATTEMVGVSWPEFGAIHPFAPLDQTMGYQRMMQELEDWLAEITGFAKVSLQPNAGSQGEFAGLMVIRAYHRARGDHHRTVCLIPQSAHGTNPASAVMAGFEVVVVKTDPQGNIDTAELARLAAAHADRLGALMVTYPSTHGVFEDGIKEVCAIIHKHGGQVYMDGANMNAQVGLTSPGIIGADVCHLNLHKTFCIPHGGGGPGMGPIGVGAHLAPYLPGHPVVPVGGDKHCGTISAAPWGSPSILPISWTYIRMMGPDGLAEATKFAILNANYVAKRLAPYYQILYSGKGGLVAHECIVDFRAFKQSAGLEVEDVAKRLIDYSFHPPTVSFPVAGTLMIEPTESESKEELDRFCDALIAIHAEIKEIELGIADRADNVLFNAPHTLQQVTADDWKRPYPREKAGFPSPETRAHKVWPTVCRIDGAFGDRNLVCTCPPIEAYA
jgi:glycine dehydrogenase